MRSIKGWSTAAVVTAAIAMATAFPINNAGAGPGLGLTISGARGRVARNKPVKLTSHVKWRGPKAKMTYAWESLQGPALPYDADRTAPNLTIAPADLDPGNYKLRLRVRAEWEDPDLDPPDQSVEVSSTIAFSVNTPPSGGHCHVRHKWVGPALAGLSIEAKDWQDPDDKQLQYRYSVKRNGKKQLLQNWRPLKKHAATVPAKPGDTLIVICEVRDRMGDTESAQSGEIKRP